MTDSESFGLGTFAVVAGGDPFPGLVLGERVLDLRSRLGVEVTVLGLLNDWERGFEILAGIAAGGPGVADGGGSVGGGGGGQGVADGGGPVDGGGEWHASAWHALASLRPLPPLVPRQILCAGANYRKHVLQIVVSSMRREGDARSEEELRAQAELQLARRESTGPFMFVAPPSALCGAQDDVVLWKPGECHDWELELAVVIGRAGRDVSEAEAPDYVAAYTISNDISVRDVMSRPSSPMTDFVTSKCRPTFFPTGPYIVPRQFVPDPRRLQIRLSVNGQVMQDESVDDIIYGVEQLVSYASRVVGLQPGDLILTGSPAGNAGHHGNRWLVPGDVMVGEITGLGTQRNLCVAPGA